MGLAVVVMLWLLLGVIIVAPIVLVRLVGLVKSSEKTRPQKLGGALINIVVGGIAILLIGFWMPIAMTVSETTDTPEERFRAVFGSEPPAELKFLASSSSYSSDWTDAYVVFSATADEFASILPPSFHRSTRGDVTVVSSWPDVPICDGESVYEEKPWTAGQFHSTSMAMVIYCPRTGIVHAGGAGLD